MANVKRCDGCGFEERTLTGSWWTLELTEGSRSWEHRLQIKGADRWVGNCSPPYHFCSLTCVRLFVENQSAESTKAREGQSTKAREAQVVGVR